MFDIFIFGDLCFIIFRLDLKYFDFELIIVSNCDCKFLLVDQWVDMLGVEIVFNVGMYDFVRLLMSCGYFQNGLYLNQFMVKEGWNLVIVLNLFDKIQYDLCIYDLQVILIVGLKKKYGCLVQGF